MNTFPLPLEYEAEIPTLPEGYKVKEEAAVTVSSVSIAQASARAVPRTLRVTSWLGRERGKTLEVELATCFF